MKNYFLIVITFFIFSCKSKSPTIPAKPEDSKTEIPEVISETKPVDQFVVLNVSEINSNQKTKAYQLGKRVLNTCNTSKFKAFSKSEATPTVIENSTETRLTKTCLKFKLRYGEFFDLEFQEAVKDNFTNETIYRYKALYSKKIANKELQVFMNEQNQITALKSKDWKAEF